MGSSEIAVKVVGAVQKPGSFRLPLGSTLEEALQSAGGWAQAPRRAAGVVTIRSLRKADGLGYVRRRLDVNKVSPRSVHLRDKDFIVVQFDVEAR